MKKILRIYLTVALLAIGGTALVLIDYFRNLDPYVYEDIFHLDRDLWPRARKCDNFPGRSIQLREGEFDRVSSRLAGQGFSEWKPLAGHRIYVEGEAPENFFAAPEKEPPVFAVNYQSGLRGRVSAVLFNPSVGELVMVISDGVF